MKFFSAATLLIAALVSAVVCLPFLPGAKENPDVFAFEVRMQSLAAGTVQVYYDTGSGFDEGRSAALPVVGSPAVQTYSLTLPPGTYQRLRFDPIDRDATVRVQSLRIVDRWGRVIRDLPLANWSAAHDIAAEHPRDGAMEIQPTSGSNDPQLVIGLTPPVRLELTWQTMIAGGPTKILLVFVALAALLLLLDRAADFRAAVAVRARLVAARPVLAVLVVSAAAVVASSYPVVFLGKSYVSPNMGTVLLYETYPTLPGYTDTRSTDVMGSDVGAIMWQHVPLSMVEARALREGEMPLWNRYNSSGTPLLGQGQSMFGDPLHFLVIAANGAAWAWDLKYLLAKWLFATGLGLLVWRLVRSERPAAAALPGTTGAALIVAAAAPFIGFFVYRFNHPAFFSLCYAPWPLYCWVRAAQANGWHGTATWAAGLMVANLALMNSGTAKEAYMLLLTMNFAGACVLIATTASVRAKLGKFAVLAWAGLLFGLITAPIWGTFLHELHNAYTSYNSASAYQIQPTLLLGAFDEIFYRPLTPANQTFSPSLNFLLLLGFLYFVATLRVSASSRSVRALALASLVPLSLAYGLVPPDWIVRVPFLANIAHIDNTFSCALIVLWAVLAGIGFAVAATRLRTEEGRGDLVIAALLLGALVFGWIAFGQAVHRPIYGPAFTVNQLGHPLPIAPFLWGYLLSLLIAAAAFAWAVRRARRRGSLTPALGLLIALCVSVLCWRHGLQAMDVGFESFVLRPTVRAPFHRKSEAVQFLQAAQRREPARAYGIRGNFFPGWNDAYALETIHGPDALMSPWYRELIGAMGGIERIWDWRVYLEPKDVGAARPFLDALNVRYYLDLHSDQGLMGRSLKLVQASDLDVYESPTVWPRAFFTNRVFAYDRLDDYIQQIRTSDGRPFAAVQRADLARNDTLAALWGEWKNRVVVSAQQYRITENTTRFSVEASGPGVVVLSEAWWPGDFRAFVNGVKVPVLRLNHAFKGVAVKAAGTYSIEFRYVPKGWYTNLGLCGVGFALLAVSAFIVLKGRGPYARPTPSTLPPFATAKSA